MKTRIFDGVQVLEGSGNVFADLALPDADMLKIKTGIVMQIREAMRATGCNHLAAAERMGISPKKVSALMRGDFTHVPDRVLMQYLHRLARPRAEPSS